MPQDPKEIRPGTEITRPLSSGEAHPYSISLTQGDLIVVEVEQQGLDVAVELFAPDGASIIRVDSPIGRWGTEVLVAVAETTGEHRLEVQFPESEAPAGQYQVRVREPRPATPEDRERARAERLFAQAENLRREKKREPYRQAVELYRQTQPIWQTLADAQREADTLYRLGWVLISLGQLRPARQELDAALAIYSQVGDPRGEAIVLNHRGMLRWTLGETEGALADVEEGLKRYRELDDPSLTVGGLSNLASLHRQLGNTAQALEIYGEVRTLSRALADRRKEARAQGSLGTLLLQLGRLEDAADHFEEVIEVWHARDDGPGEAFAWHRLGEVRSRQKRFEEALECFEKALVLHREAGNRPNEAATLVGLGTAHLLSGQLEEGRKAYAEALTVFEEIGDRLGEALLRVNMGRLELMADRPREALTHHEQAAPVLATAGYRQVEASNLYGIARALHDLGDFATARARLEATLEHVEQLRVESSRETLKIAFFATKQQYYDLYIDVLGHLEDTEPGAGHVARAFEASERRRSRALLDLLGESAAEIRGGANPKLLERESELQRRLNENERHRSELLSQDHEAEAIAQLEKQQRQLHLELDKVRHDLRQASPRYAALRRPRTASLEEVREGLLRSPRTVLLSYSLGEERSFLWRVTRDTISSYVLPGREEIEKAALDAQHLLKQVRRSAEANLQLHLNHLSEILLAPVAEELKDGQRLLIIADGALLTLPFPALPKPGTDLPLVAEHEIVYLPSASVLLALRRETEGRDPAPKQLAIYADPVVSSAEAEPSPLHDELRRSAGDFGNETLEPLPYARQEADAIWEIAHGDKERWLGFEASKTNLLHVDKLRDYQILHFATHGLLNRSQPNLSGLVLSLYDEDGEPEDGFLRLHEIYNLDLNAELVVLSACATGLGTLFPGEGLLGLSRGFLYAGAPRVLVSLWNVNDEATAELMKRFYWSLLETGASPGLALRAAQESLREEEKWRHPYYWAPFVLVGEWRRPTEGEPPIEETDAGEGQIIDPDIDYPGPDEEWCQALPEPWMRRLCNILRRLSTPRSPRAAAGQNAFNGIDASTGEDLQEPLSDRQLTSRILGSRRDEREEREIGWWNGVYEKNSVDRRPAEDVNPLDLASSGWGVIFAEESPEKEAIREALRPLLEHRRDQGGDYYKGDLVYQPGQTKEAFFKHYDVEQGPAHPEQLPYYLLIVGSTEEIPYRFQYLLDLQYAVGRLSFEDVESYARYAESVVAVERDGRHDVLPEMHFFSVLHEGDAATQISEKHLIRPLRRHLSRERESWDLELTEKGRKEDLATLLGGGETPALLFTAAHGVGYRSGHPQQAHNQGAILCQDWPGRGSGPLRPAHYFAAADLGADVHLRGLIAFLFGCYSAGTPQLDNFPPAPLRNPIVRAPQSFVSPLARRLLSHPNGSALAVLGHVDRTWTRSFGTGRGMGYLHVVSLLKRLLDGYPVGAAMDWMNERFAEISTELTDVLDARAQALRYPHRTGTASRPPDRAQLAGLWRANNDARNFVVLGDPAVRLADGPRTALQGEEARAAGKGAGSLRAPGTPCPTCGRT